MNDHTDEVSNDSSGLPTATSAEHARKNPDEWVTGDQPMTEGQASYLKTLSEKTGERFDSTLSKADAVKRIEELQHKTRGGRLKRIVESEQTDG